MLTPSEAKQQSEVINSLRLPATVLVIVSHCVITLSGKPLNFELTSENIFAILEQLCLSFGPLAVALFSLISGYFFFYKLNNFGLKQYGQELRKRFTSLLIPYVIWNLIAIALIGGKNYIGMHLNIRFAYNEAEWMNIINQNIWQLLWVSLDNPLWYIREIIILAIASPIIYLLIRDKKLGGLLTSLLSIWACLYYIPWLRSSHITLFFIWGAYFGLHKMNILKLCTRISYLSYPLGLLYPYMRIFAEGESWTKPLLLPGLALSVIMLFNIAGIIHSKWQYISKWLSERNNAIFFMYAAHWILYINIIRGSLYSLLPWDNDIEKIVALLLTCTIVPMATYYSYKLLAYLFPTLTQWLCGGRG